jgi:serine protease Do
VRLLRITGVDLNLFEFDYDLTWAAFFMNGSGKVYGRYGGRDAKGPDTRNSLTGLRFAMQAALEEHRRDPQARPAGPAKAPVLVENFPSAKNVRNGCIHCHQVKEILRQEQFNERTWNRDNVYTYPLPENVGITLDVDRGNLVKSILENSPAGKVGVKAGAILRTLNHVPIHSFADAQYALHKAPKEGQIPIAWESAGQTKTGNLEVSQNWKRTNITWRPSLLDLLPALTVYGSDLTAKEKEALGLDAKRLAFRQEPPVHTAAKAMGVQEGDIILGVDNKTLEMSMTQFLGYIRQNYLIGETLTLNLLRDRKKLDLKIQLK